MLSCPSEHSRVRYGEAVVVVVAMVLWSTSSAATELQNLSDKRPAID